MNIYWYNEYILIWIKSLWKWLKKGLTLELSRLRKFYNFLCLVWEQCGSIFFFKLFLQVPFFVWKFISKPKASHPSQRHPCNTGVFKEPNSHLSNSSYFTNKLEKWHLKKYNFLLVIFFHFREISYKISVLKIWSQFHCVLRMMLINYIILNIKTMSVIFVTCNIFGLSAKYFSRFILQSVFQFWYIYVIFFL